MNSFHPGRPWLDTEGKLIQAHGGSILIDSETYYWFGEDKNGKTVGQTQGLHRVDVVGIHCYSSQNLYDWKDEGIVLPADPDDPESDLHPSRVVERPKVIRNPRTGEYVMWLHIDTRDYETARTGVAVSSKPCGPYRYEGSFRPNGNDSRDMTVFQDDDGQAYLIYSSEWNKTMHIALLAEDYLSPAGKEMRIFENLSREAPAIFKQGGLYYLVTSGCTGWDANPAQAAVAPSIWGQWQITGNPCTGPGADKTFGAQSTFIFSLEYGGGQTIFMTDIWNKHDLRTSRYAWLPVQLDGGALKIAWRDQWSLE